MAVCFIEVSNSAALGKCPISEPPNRSGGAAADFLAVDITFVRCPHYHPPCQYCTFICLHYALFMPRQCKPLHSYTVLRVFTCFGMTLGWKHRERQSISDQLDEKQNKSRDVQVCGCALYAKKYERNRNSIKCFCFCFFFMNKDKDILTIMHHLFENKAQTCLKLDHLN